MADEAVRAEFVAWNEHGGRHPVVFLQTWLAEDGHWPLLAAALGIEQPIFCSSPPSVEFPTDVAGWVRHHRRTLERLGIAPPYRLAGFSFGGVVALELARQLRSEGIEVEWIAMIDSLRPLSRPKRPGPWLAQHARELLALPTREQQLLYVKRHTAKLYSNKRLRQRKRMLRLRNAVAVRAGRADLTKRTATELHHRRLRKSVALSWSGYRATPYDGPVTLLSGPSLVAKAYGDRSLRWSGYLQGGFELRVIEGKHRQLFAPEHIHSVGAALRAALDRADEDATSARMTAR